MVVSNNTLTPPTHLIFCLQYCHIIIVKKGENAKNMFKELILYL